MNNNKIKSIEKMYRREYNDGNMTAHADEERQYRITLANRLIHNENATLADTFKVDKGHRNGLEIHNVYTNGVVKIYNLNTHRLITTLIARPTQITRYYEACGIINTIPNEIINKCMEHKGLHD